MNRVQKWLCKRAVKNKNSIEFGKYMRRMRKEGKLDDDRICFMIRNINDTILPSLYRDLRIEEVSDSVLKASIEEGKQSDNRDVISRYIENMRNKGEELTDSTLVYIAKNSNVSACMTMCSEVKPEELSEEVFEAILNREDKHQNYIIYREDDHKFEDRMSVINEELISKITKDILTKHTSTLKELLLQGTVSSRDVSPLLLGLEGVGAFLSEEEGDKCLSNTYFSWGRTSEKEKINKTLLDIRARQGEGNERSNCSVS